MARKLVTLEDLRRYLSHVINGTETGKIPPPVAGKLIYGCNVLKGVIEGTTLEDRVAALEASLKEKSP